MVDPELIRQGGFAFAAVLLGGLLIWGARIVVGFANKREEFIDRLMKNNSEMAEAVMLNAESTKTLTFTMSSSLAANTDAVKEMTKALQEMRLETARGKGGL